VKIRRGVDPTDRWAHGQVERKVDEDVDYRRRNLDRKTHRRARGLGYQLGMKTSA